MKEIQTTSVNRHSSKSIAMFRTMNVRNDASWHKAQTTSIGGKAMQTICFHLVDDSSTGYIDKQVSICRAVANGAIWIFAKFYIQTNVNYEKLYARERILVSLWNAVKISKGQTGY